MMRSSYKLLFKPLSKPLSKPLLAIFGCLLLVDNAVLFAFAKFKFGTIVPFLIGLIFAIHAFRWQFVKSILDKSPIYKQLWQGLWGLFFVWLLSFVAFIGYLQYQIHSQPALSQIQSHAKAVIVLGSGVNGDKPTPTLASRLDKASGIIKQNNDILPIVSGGVGFARKHSEAYVMAKYLADTHGVDFSGVKQEGESTSTAENLQFSKPILHRHGVRLSDSIAIVTNDFHIIRAQAIAKKQGYQHVSMVASHTPISIVFNAWFREYFAYISGWLLGEY